jgi:UPF0755 protein
LKRLLFILTALVLLAVAAGVVLVAVHVYRPYKAYTAAEQFVEIPQGSSVPAIARRLEQAGVVRNALAFRYAAWVTQGTRAMKAGEYRFDRPMSAIEVAEKIARGDVYVRPLTFREGLTMWEMAEVFEREGYGTRQAFLDAASRSDLIRSLDPEAADLEGYLFPDTYSVPRGITADRLVAMMVGHFKNQFEATLPARAAASGRTVREIVTLASLVEEETGRAEERPIVAGVYANRLKIGMGLQCDPTVLYALRRAGRDVANITRADLQFDSPYNTYRYAGLPPGPIASPGKASVDAALDPADVPYLYFVSRNDGSHVFATTLAEHNRNVYQWQILYWREQRRKQAEAQRQ